MDKSEKHNTSERKEEEHLKSDGDGQDTCGAAG